MNPWDELSRSIRNLQNLLIEGVKITSNALERIKHVETSKAPRGTFGDHPDPHSWPSEEEAGEALAHDGLRPAGAHAESDRRVRGEAGGAARPAGRGTSHDAPGIQARSHEHSGVDITPALASKEIVCPVCYLATTITVINEPRTPAPGMLWACHECNELSVFDENLDLRIASDAEKSKARPAKL